MRMKLLVGSSLNFVDVVPLVQLTHLLLLLLIVQIPYIILMQIK